DVDEGAAARGDHTRNEGVATEIDRFQLRPPRLVPFLFGDVEDGSEPAGRGAVDHDMDTPAVGDRCDLVPQGSTPDVAMQGRQKPAGRLKIRGGFLEG